ncbi:ribosomal RNA small subunit methyltransferase I-like isoform X2 [Salvia splendens]|uniref:ribosomal RNA small subunit methyltransferase I-like isoform X2 n=1 Tax=Salvia splendens TaxID=180675 RepID=UPI001C25478A|nr:ribosomal RNA small subunit methyltransferase I-like isoform X2 [Salvia splendens]
MKLLRLCHSMAVPFAIHLRRPAFPLHCPILLFPSNHFLLSASAHRHTITSAISFSTCNHQPSPSSDLADDFPSKQGPLKPGLYLVGTPIGNLEDITLRALKVLKSADVILSEDTRHSGKLLMYYKIRTPLLSYHKFNESQREQVVLKRLLGGEIVALISDAGMPGISDPGMELAKLCVDKNIPVIPVPGPSAVVAALSASGLPTNEFTFVGFLPKHSTTRRERLMVSANSATTQVFFVPPHKLCQFLEESSSIFGNSRPISELPWPTIFFFQPLAPADRPSCSPQPLAPAAPVATPESRPTHPQWGDVGLDPCDPRPKRARGAILTTLVQLSIQMTVNSWLIRFICKNMLYLIKKIIFFHFLNS